MKEMADSQQPSEALSAIERAERASYMPSADVGEGFERGVERLHGGGVGRVVFRPPFERFVVAAGAFEVMAQVFAPGVQASPRLAGGQRQRADVLFVLAGQIRQAVA